MRVVRSRVSHLSAPTRSSRWNEISAKLPATNPTNTRDDEEGSVTSCAAHVSILISTQVTGNPITEEEAARRKRAEQGAYDGVSQIPNAAALGAMGQQPGGPYPPGTERPNVEDQIRYLHDKYKK